MIMYFTIYMYYMVRVHRKRPYALHIHSPWYVRLIQHQHLRPPLIRTCTAGAGEGKSSEFQMSPISPLHQFIIFRAAFNYELSLFVVKNLCYIFMLCHSLYPGEMQCCNFYTNPFLQISVPTNFSTIRHDIIPFLKNRTCI